MKSALSTASLPLTDEYGLLCDPGQWTEFVAGAMAQQLGIDSLTRDHWDVIYTLREYFSKFGVAPTMKNVCRSNNKSTSWVHDLFGSCLNAWRVAGLPDPGEEAKSYLSDM